MRIFVFMIFVSISLPVFGLTIRGNNALKNAELLEVVSGSTFKVKLDGKEELLHLIGVECPVAIEGDPAKEQARRLNTTERNVVAMGKLIAKHTKHLIDTFNQPAKDGKHYIVLVFGKKQRDANGHLMAYVYAGKGAGAMYNGSINDRQLKNGMGWFVGNPGDSERLKILNESYQEAVTSKKLLWRKLKAPAAQ